MHIVVSGSTGLLGRALVSHFEADGHEVTPLVRPTTSGARDGIPWSPSAGELDPARLEGVDAVVHLAGESINQRWNERTKARILNSRVEGTSLLAETLAGLDDPPEVFVSASAIGYYGDRGDTRLTEDADPGDLFISDVCEQWEAAAQPAAENGIRVVNPRIGVVLSEEGGALPQMLPPFRFGLGGHLGSGEQWMSWVTREEFVGAIDHILNTEELAGPVNVCSPNPVTNRTFTNVLGEALNRPTVTFVPGFAVNLMFGQMGEELLLASARVEPTKLEASGYEFEQPDLEPALRQVLGKN
jgi:uncharacterized protein (TIGR01777 family)